MKISGFSKKKSRMFFALILTNTLIFSQIRINVNAQQKPKIPKIDIHTAVATGNLATVMQHIAAGTNINLKDALGGSSPLITACLYEKMEIAQYLIKAGADLNFQNNDGSTALHISAFFCKPTMLKLLLANKANKAIKNNFGSLPIDIVSAPFETIKPIYEQMKPMLEPIGVKLDLDYIQKTRPLLAKMLK